MGEPKHSLDPENKYDIRNLADECWPNVSFGTADNGEELDPTTEQCTALFRKWKMNHSDKTWYEFAKSAKPTLGMNDAITIEWSGMWLAIEQDGYTHSWGKRQ